MKIAYSRLRRFAELRGDDETPDTDERPEAFDTIRLALTGDPAIGSVLGTVTADSEHVQAEAPELLGNTYQGAAMMVKIAETHAAWIAADRAGFCAEAAGSPLAVAASMFRMAHVFLALSQIDQAHHVATSIAQALEPKITGTAEPEVLSLCEASHLALAVAAARDNKRGEAHQHLGTARKIAGQLGQDPDDYGTAFGPPKPTPCGARSAKPCTLSRRPSASPRRKPASTTQAALWPVICSSSPACGHGPNCATSQNDSAYCPSPGSRVALPNYALLRSSGAPAAPRARAQP